LEDEIREPAPVRLPQQTLNDVDELRAWLAEVEQLSLAQVAKDPLIF
jgi:hypothetical protein